MRPKKIREPKFVVTVVKCSIAEGECILAPWVLQGATGIYRGTRMKVQSAGLF